MSDFDLVFLLGIFVGLAIAASAIGVFQWRRYKPDKPDTRDICPVGGERFDKVHQHWSGGVRILPRPTGPPPPPSVPPPPSGLA